MPNELFLPSLGFYGYGLNVYIQAPCLFSLKVNSTMEFLTTAISVILGPDPYIFLSPTIVQQTKGRTDLVAFLYRGAKH